MCWCTPSIRTPNCGKIGCVPPAKSAEVVEAHTGWRPPVIYDIHNDMFRVATQEDFDRLRRIADEATKALAKMRDVLKEMDEASWRKPVVITLSGAPK